MLVSRFLAGAVPVAPRPAGWESWCAEGWPAFGPDCQAMPLRLAPSSSFSHLPRATAELLQARLRRAGQDGAVRAQLEASNRQAAREEDVYAATHAP